MPRAWLWEDSTAGEDVDSHCVPPALRNTPSPLLWLLRANRLCPLHAVRKGGGGGDRRSRFLAQTGYFAGSTCG